MDLGCTVELGGEILNLSSAFGARVVVFLIVTTSDSATVNMWPMSGRMSVACAGVLFECRWHRCQGTEHIAYINRNASKQKSQNQFFTTVLLRLAFSVILIQQNSLEIDRKCGDNVISA